MNVAFALKGFVTLLWIVIIGLGVLIVLRSSRGSNVRKLTTIVVGLVIGTVLLTIVSAGLVFIQPEERCCYLSNCA